MKRKRRSRCVLKLVIVFVFVLDILSGVTTQAYMPLDSEYDVQASSIMVVEATELNSDESKTQEDSNLSKIANVILKTFYENTIEEQPLVFTPKLAILPTVDLSNGNMQTRLIAIREKSIDSNVVENTVETEKVETEKKTEAKKEEKVENEEDTENEVITPEPQVLEEYSQVNEYLLAQAIHCEAGGTGDLNEMMYCGKVMLNRMISNASDFKNVTTLEEVLNQSNQYPETIAKIRSGIVPCDEAKEAAHRILCGETLYYQDKDGVSRVFGEDVLWQTGFFPSWNVDVIFQSEYHYYSVLHK
jgi:hypothetical protein